MVHSTFNYDNSPLFSYNGEDLFTSEQTVSTSCSAVFTGMESSDSTSNTTLTSKYYSDNYDEENQYGY